MIRREYEKEAYFEKNASFYFGFFNDYVRYNGMQAKDLYSFI